MIDNTKEYILCAAIKRKFPNKAQPYLDGTNDICNIEIGYRHHDIYQRFNDREKHPDFEDCPLGLKMEDQGFYTSKGRFVNRTEGMEIALEAGQVTEEQAYKKNNPDWISESTPTGDTELLKSKYNPLFSEDLY